MSQEERYGMRCSAYSVWHRRRSIGRYCQPEDARILAMIDVDAALWIEYDDSTKNPIALLETAVDVGQSYKTATVINNLAIKAQLPAFVVLYALSAEKNPEDGSVLDISGFRVQQLYPKRESRFVNYTPSQYARFLLSLRHNREKNNQEVLRNREKLTNELKSEFLFTLTQVYSRVNVHNCDLGKWIDFHKNKITYLLDKYANDL